VSLVLCLAAVVVIVAVAGTTDVAVVRVVFVGVAGVVVVFAVGGVDVVVVLSDDVGVCGGCVVDCWVLRDSAVHAAVVVCVLL